MSGAGSFSREGDDPYVSVTVFPPFAAPYTQSSIRQMTSDGLLFPIGAVMGYAPPPPRV